MDLSHLNRILGNGHAANIVIESFARCHGICVSITAGASIAAARGAWGTQGGAGFGGGFRA